MRGQGRRVCLWIGGHELLDLRFGTVEECMDPPRPNDPGRIISNHQGSFNMGFTLEHQGIERRPVVE